MPLPWVMIFFLIFLCLYSLSLYTSSFVLVNSVSVGKLNSSSVVLPW